MEINPQLLKNGNKIEFAVLPCDVFVKMKELIEDYEDLLELRKDKEHDARSNGKSAVDLRNELLTVS